MEMRQLIQMTGGYLVIAESFEHNMFKDTLRKVFARDGNGNLNMGFNATMEVQTSRELKVMGAIGHLVSMGKKSASVSDRSIGEGDTCAWRICGIDPLSSFGIYFSTVNQEQAPKRNQKGLIQITTSYIDSAGANILRVTTLARPFVTGGVPGVQQQDMMVDPLNPKAALSAGFDQEAAAVLMARLAVFKTREESSFDIIRWLDRSLISASQQFGEFLKGDPGSFRLSRQFGLLPQFFFHLRRSCFLQNFNNSPDESTYYRYMLLRENCPNSMTMIQPRLEAYTFQQKGFPVLLSSTSLAADRILMLDTFFHVVIWHGKSIAEWKAKGYQNDPNYASFRDLLQAPQDDAKNILVERIPTPLFKSCDFNQGDSRYLLAVIDPAQTYSSNNPAGAGETIATDDVNLQVFVEHLAKLTVQGDGS
jgi:protein transport protein SEC23